jgi:hypothetical protein
MKHLKKFLVLLVAVVASYSTIEATQTSLFWTNCTTHVLPTGLGQLDVYNYFTVWNKRNHNQYFAPNVGLELGVFSWDYVEVEAGFDFEGGTDDPLLFNAKAAVEEDVLFCGAPSFSISMFDFGTRYHGEDRTNFNILGFVVGKSFSVYQPVTIFTGGFVGNRIMGQNRGGFWVGLQTYFCPAVDCCGVEYHKWELIADYASGKNVLGGGGVGVGYYLNPHVVIETGPTFFNTRKYNGRWKWSVQIHIQFEVFDACRSCF